LLGQKYRENPTTPSVSLFLCHNDGTWCAKPKAEGGAEIKKRENLGEKGYKEIGGQKV
jgi:hypothetical protein